jgi:hypothetical protein
MTSYFTYQDWSQSRPRLKYMEVRLQSHALRIVSLQVAVIAAFVGGTDKEAKSYIHPKQ